MSEAVIRIENAYVTYGNIAALAKISLQVCAGESVALLGPNGAGKTTLLTAINGFTPLTSGAIKVLGRIPGGRTLLEVRRRVGYVAQTAQVDSRMPITVRESVMTGIYGRLGWRRSVPLEDRARVDATLERLGILALASRPLGHLSGGEMRRTMIARALLQEPQILLLDEPTASLDDHARRDICNLMGELNRKQGLTLLWVTHDLDMLPDSCTRVLHMKNGSITQDGSPHRYALSAPESPAVSHGSAPARWEVEP